MIQIWILINMCPTDPSYSLIPEYFIMLKAQQGQIWIPNKFWALGNIYPFHLNIIKITIDQPIYIYLSLTHEQDLIIIFNHYSTFPLVDDNNFIALFVFRLYCYFHNVWIISIRGQGIISAKLKLKQLEMTVK